MQKSLFPILIQLLFASYAVLQASDYKPNILVIYADDLGYGDLQCYNPERGKIPTPTIDQLAAKGMRFTDGHSSSGVCSPFCYTLLTGEDKPIRVNAVSTSIQGTPAFRSGSWKYIPAPGSGGWGKGGDPSQPVQLYNLADDLGETRNLASAMPEKVAEMAEMLEKLIRDGRSTSGSQQRNDVEVVRYPNARN